MFESLIRQTSPKNQGKSELGSQVKKLERSITETRDYFSVSWSVLSTFWTRNISTRCWQSWFSFQTTMWIQRVSIPSGAGRPNLWFLDQVLAELLTLTSALAAPIIDALGRSYKSDQCEGFLVSHREAVQGKKPSLHLKTWKVFSGAGVLVEGPGFDSLPV